MSPPRLLMGKAMSDIDHVQAAAYAACCKVSPSDPLAVTEAIEEAFAILRDARRTVCPVGDRVRALLSRLEGKAP